MLLISRDVLRGMSIAKMVAGAAIVQRRRKSDFRTHSFSRVQRRNRTIEARQSSMEQVDPEANLGRER